MTGLDPDTIPQASGNSRTACEEYTRPVFHRTTKGFFLFMGRSVTGQIALSAYGSVVDISSSLFSVEVKPVVVELEDDDEEDEEDEEDVEVCGAAVNWHSTTLLSFRMCENFLSACRTALSCNRK